MHTPSPEVEERMLGWKTTYGEVIVLEFGGRDYVFRAVSPKEWDQIQLATELNDPALIDDLHGELLEACKLWPEDFELENLPITAFNQLYESVQSASPFGTTQAFHATLLRYRTRTQTMMGAVRTMIHTAFPAISEDAIDEFSTHKLFLHLTLAEQILGVEFQVPGFEERGTPASMTPEQIRAAKAQGAMQRKQERRQQQAANYHGAAPSPTSDPPIPQSPSPATAAFGSGAVMTAADFEADAASLRKALLDG